MELAIQDRKMKPLVGLKRKHTSSVGVLEGKPDSDEEGGGKSEGCA